MTTYITVPVPEELVPAVYRLIAEHQASPAKAEKPAVDEPDDEAGRDWSFDDLQLIADSDASSVRSFADVLTLLADASPTSMTIGEIGEQLGEKGLTLQNRFGAVTRWMRGRVGDDVRWPIRTAGGVWAMNEHNAELWKQIRS